MPISSPSSSPKPSQAFAEPVQTPPAPAPDASPAGNPTATSGQPYEPLVKLERRSFGYRKLMPDDKTGGSSSLERVVPSRDDTKKNNQGKPKKKVHFAPDTKPEPVEESKGKTKETWKGGEAEGSLAHNKKDDARLNPVGKREDPNWHGEAQAFNNPALLGYQQLLQKAESERQQQLKMGIFSLTEKQFADTWDPKANKNKQETVDMGKGAKAIELIDHDIAIGSVEAGASLICYAKLVVEDNKGNKRTFCAVIQAAPPRKREKINATQSHDTVIKPLFEALQQAILENESIEVEPKLSDVEFRFLGANESSRDFALATMQVAEEVGKNALGQLPLNKNNQVTSSFMKLNGIFYAQKEKSGWWPNFKR